MAEENLEKLFRKLATTAKVIIGLLAVGADSVVEKKLSQLEELIAEIPSYLEGKCALMCFEVHMIIDQCSFISFIVSSFPTRAYHSVAHQGGKIVDSISR